MAGILSREQKTVWKTEKQDTLFVDVGRGRRYISLCMSIEGLIRDLQKYEKEKDDS